uniref:Telomerase protein component 1like [Hydra vulgaris] n=1 Tax=Lepeophtheirus salmonis TaxID=72036 RepID=A0A0K2U611_LEPSM
MFSWKSRHGKKCLSLFCFSIYSISASRASLRRVSSASASIPRASVFLFAFSI